MHLGVLDYIDNKFYSMLLSELSHPNQLHGLTVSQLEEIACQIRERHLQVVSTSGGHLGPGLGVVELTLALYQTLDLDFDKVVWDVGHQGYPHKLITGRFNNFDSLRQQKEYLVGVQHEL